MNPDRARSAVSAAIRKGILKRLPCEVCGGIPAEGHHENYNRPLDVRWLCKVHHMRLHGERRRKKNRRLGLLKTPMTTHPIILPVKIWREIDRMADKDGRTVGNLVRFVLQQYVNGGK